MKKLLSIILVVSLFSSCYDPNYVPVQRPVVVQTQPVGQQYQVITDPLTGQQQVMFYDGTQQMLMDYILFNQLMGNGGYNNVITYYHRTPSIRRVYEPTRYKSWKQTAAPSTWSSGYSSKNYDNSSAKSSGWETKSSSKAVTVRPTSGYSSTKSYSPASQSKSSGYSSFKTSPSSSSTKSSGYSSFKSSSSSSSRSSGSGYSSGKRRN